MHNCQLHKIQQSGGFLATRRTASDKILCDKAFNIAKNPRHDRYQKVLASMIYKFFDKKNSGGGAKN